MQRRMPRGFTPQTRTKPRQIYALLDPRYNTVCYVGMTKDAQQRLQQHLWYTGHGKQVTQWLRELEKLGLTPEMFILEEIEAGPDAYYMACERERFWIEEMLQMGQLLLNVPGNTRPYSRDS
jgi:hypothetical protein